MSKIICDVCGTSYPETSAQCPICGSARPVQVHASVADGAAAAQGSGYTYVKGGRFSKANVRKRNMAMQAAGDAAMEDLPESNTKTRLLIVTAIVLILAIIAVAAYIVIHFFDLFGSGQRPTQSTQTSASVSTQPSTDPSTQPIQESTLPSDTDPEEIPCTDITLVKTQAQLTTAGEAYVIEATPVPETTTDILTFASSDETVATVTPGGLINAVGNGEAEITIACGEITQTFTVTCIIETLPPVTKEDLKFNREDFTLFAKDATHKLYTGDIDVKQITWISDNEAVAKFEEGIVTAVGPGKTTVRAKCGDVETTCIVRCEFPGSTGTGGVMEEGSSGSATYTINKTDVTISRGEKFTLTLKDSAGNVLDVQWTVNKPEVCSVSGNSVEGLSSGTAVVKTIYNGNEYSCIVRVKK